MQPGLIIRQVACLELKGQTSARVSKAFRRHSPAATLAPDRLDELSKSCKVKPVSGKSQFRAKAAKVAKPLDNFSFATFAFFARPSDSIRFGQDLQSGGEKFLPGNPVGLPGNGKFQMGTRGTHPSDGVGQPWTHKFQPCGHKTQRATPNSSRETIKVCQVVIKPSHAAPNSCREVLNFCPASLFSTIYAKSSGPTAKYPKYPKSLRMATGARFHFVCFGYFAVQSFSRPNSQLLTPKKYGRSHSHPHSDTRTRTENCAQARRGEPRLAR